MKKALLPLFEFLETVAIAAAAVFFVKTFIAQPFLVSGASMESNFYNGDYLVVDELSYRFREPVRGEVVIFKFQGDKKRPYYIKRIIGLPGERLKISGDKVLVYKDGEFQSLREDYISLKGFSSRVDVTLGEKEYFVMGDNRNFSFDSRSWGPVLKGDVVGLARFRLWPVTRIQAFGAPQYNK